MDLSMDLGHVTALSCLVGICADVDNDCEARQAGLVVLCVKLLPLD